MNRRRSTYGFTLIELLVVVSIIALLVSILLPSLARARELAKRAVCSANLRSLGTASHIYGTEYGGYIPFGAGWPYFLTSLHGPWGVLFDAGIFDDWGAQDQTERAMSGVADQMFCPSQRNGKFLQRKRGQLLADELNPTARSSYQGRYFFPPGNSPWSAKKLSKLPSATAFAADVIIYDSKTHLEEGINVARVDASVVWFRWPGSVSFWRECGGACTYQELEDYWAYEFDMK